MFKKSGRGFKKPFCINEQCPNFTPEDKRGGYKKKTADETKTTEAAKNEAAVEENTASADVETPAPKKRGRPKKVKAE